MPNSLEDANHQDDNGGHRIQLHGPWQLVASPATRVQVPLAFAELESQVPPASFTDKLELVRKFGCPTGLSPRSVVTLHWDSAGREASLSFNDSQRHHVTPGSAWQLDITELLKSRNTIQVTLNLNHPDESTTLEHHWLIRSVWLEITESE